MILVFLGDPQELASGRGLSRQSITLEGVTFVMNEPRDASQLSDKLRAKLANNSHFKVVAEIDGEATEIAPEGEAADAGKKPRGKKAEA